MTQEEKAKRYDDLLVKLQKAKTDNNVCDDRYCCVIDDIVPELKESKDERISKHLLYHFRNKTKKEWNGIPVKDIIAYLEKQEQHKKFRDSIQVGDKVTKNEDGVLVNLSQMKRVAKKDEKQGEKKPADKVEPKFKIGDVIRLKGSAAEYTIKRVTDTTYYTDGWSCSIERCEEDYELVEQKSVWSEEDERRFNNLCFLINQSDENVPTKEGFINWLKSFCHHKHNHTSWWYECIKECVGFKVGNVYNSDGEWIYGDNKKCAYDERFFHPQSHWKPSDEQMKALQTAIGIVGELTPTASLLKEIREQLKKLWEE